MPVTAAAHVRAAPMLDDLALPGHFAGAMTAP
jgi:hypothetical protein